ncbi:slipin family protein [Luteimonas sp. Y-2-2-4F]|nr:slipin family protein [Luteimonas sp. Y-2-2-4F]MCD9033089.1 slipin family protein [Luteimonas sp. Y-2-2-4F]
MFWTKRVVIGDGERGLVYRNRRFERVLEAGVHRWFDPFGRIEVRSFDIATPEYAGPDVDALVARLGDALAGTFVLADIGVDEVGLVSKNGKLEDVLAPGTRRLYWKGLVEVQVRTVPLGGTLEVEAAVSRRLRQLGTLSRVAVVADVPAEHACLVFVDGELRRTLAPGSHAFWNFRKNVVVDIVDLRVQAVEVSGQELLTRDKVSLRVNLAASTRVIDAVATRTRVARIGDHVYRELQYGLRRAVSAKSLDELLGDKASLDADIFAYVRGQMTGLGVEVLGVGVKDVILPGEMKEILNGVVQAEKTAQANVIRRREEANATRSLLNTARLIEESPVLMRLKELEALEKVTERIDKLTVFGGLDGVLKQLVTLKQ